MAADWLKRILERLIQQLSQWLSFMGVFRGWQIQSDDHIAPVLMIPNHAKTNKNDASWIVYKIEEDKLLNSDLSPPPYDCVFLGSSEGWLGTLTKKLEIILYKPFDKKKTRLLPSLPPPEKQSLDEVCNWWVMRFITFTPDPIMNPTDLICIAIFGDKFQLAYIRPDIENEWRLVKAFPPSAETIKEVLYHNGQFYAVSFTGLLLSFNLMDTSNPTARKVLSVPCPRESNRLLPYKDYLVESPKGELLYIERYTDRKSANKHNYLTKKFLVWKLSYDEAMPMWEKLDSIGQCALFLGENASISVFAPSNNHGCTEDCIYFTDDKYTFFRKHHKPPDIGLYNLKTKTVTRGFGIDKTIFANIKEGRFPIFIDRKN